MSIEKCESLENIDGECCTQQYGQKKKPHQPRQSELTGEKRKKALWEIRSECLIGAYMHAIFIAIACGMCVWFEVGCAYENTNGVISLAMRRYMDQC